MSYTYKTPVGVDYLDPDATLSDAEFDKFADAWVEELQSRCDSVFGDGAVEVVGVPESISFGNRNDDGDPRAATIYAMTEDGMWEAAAKRANIS